MTDIETVTTDETTLSEAVAPPSIKPTLWQAFKLSIISTMSSLPVLLFAFFLLLTQLMLLPKEAPLPTTASDFATGFSWLCCLLSVACLSILFQAGWMHLLVERTKTALKKRNNNRLWMLLLPSQPHKDLP